jgi:hypothetical protein
MWMSLLLFRIKKNELPQIFSAGVRFRPVQSRAHRALLGERRHRIWDFYPNALRVVARRYD